MKFQLHRADEDESSKNVKISDKAVWDENEVNASNYWKDGAEKGAWTVEISSLEELIDFCRKETENDKFCKENGYSVIINLNGFISGKYSPELLICDYWTE